MESKYRYRNAAPVIEDTGEALPVYYWKLKESDGVQAANARLASDFDGAKVGPKKFPDGWRVVRYIGGGDGKVENPNPADMFNTVLKMAKKRAFVDATITATACNDLFTQDLEDIRANLDAVEVAPKEQAGFSPQSDERNEATEEKPIAPPKTSDWKGVKVANIEPLGESTWLISFQKGEGVLVAGTHDGETHVSCVAIKSAGAECDVGVKPGRKPGSFAIVSVTAVDSIPM